MLNIITPLYRFDLLKKVYNSILFNDDIRWHISKSTCREKLNYDFLKTDKRIILYNVDCVDSDTTMKRNTVFENIKDGYFCLLDDDTIFHENMYMKYLECKDNNYIGMVVGQQLNINNSIRLRASKPLFGKIDTGNVISHYSCLTECKWPKTHIPKVNQKDFLFWDSVYKFYNEKCELWNQPISYYNKLNNQKNGTEKKTILHITGTGKKIN
jgi:hypothetical protein